ncbi:MAG: peptidoglycan DD-metalloendopeptidase family protein [Lachnospiraceae bacterium]|jgi:murein DD-endopeptidase MepM/ murein hydrolase activator NlpD|nr:peptidoglycan DD-metalloendopeptidase family protein [Lachnospiraceae bacterium]
MKKRLLMGAGIAGFVIMTAVAFFGKGGNDIFREVSDTLRGDVHIVHASRLTNDAIKNMEGQISNTKKEQDQMKNALTNVQSIRRQLESSRNDLDRFIRELDQNMEIVEQNIADLLIMIENKEAEIVQKTKELEEAIAVQEAQYAAMKVRVSLMYEQGETHFIALLLDADSIGDILNRVDFIEMLARYDKSKFDEYVAFSTLVALIKESLELEKELLEQAREAVEAEREALAELIEEKNLQIRVVMGDIARQEQAIREYEAEIAAQNEIIRALERAVAAERARLAAAQARRFDGGPFTWPVPSSRRITDDYGNRIHPILKVPQFHNGIDIPAPTGATIVSAHAGVVVAAAYNATMGNYIMINHGDGVFTIYMHASQLFVSEGAEVSAGQRIAAVGSTGRSTGPHLHFSVRVSGAYVNPWGYFGG